MDTGTRKLECFDADLKAGTLTNRRTLVEIPEAHGHPDGLTLDAEGNVWLAMWDGHAVRCYDGQTGEERAKIDVPAAKTSCCCFGGEDRKNAVHHHGGLRRPGGGQAVRLPAGGGGAAGESV